MVTTPGWIDFEGGGRDTSECVEPCLGCDGGPGDPDDPGGGGGGGDACDAVFEFTEPAFDLSDAPCNSSGGCLTRLADTQMAVGICTGPADYGALFIPVQNLFDTAPFLTKGGSSISWFIRFGTVVTGSPIVGICNWVEDGSTAENFTGWGLVVNFVTGEVGLHHWVNQPLSVIPEPLDIATFAVTEGMILSLVMDQLPGEEGNGTNGIFGAVYDATFATQLLSLGANFNDVQAVTGTNRHGFCNVGLLAIATPAIARTAFVHSPDVSCNDSLTPFMIMQSCGGGF